MKPTFIGLGVQKCASTWLHAIFADHPEAFVSTPKELNFFSSNFERGFQWYEKHFAAAGPDRAAVGEISPSYFPDGDAPARAHAYCPRFRILVALRDPIDRAYSNFLHDVRLGYYQSDAPSFEDALANNPMYVDQSLYGRHIRHWLDYFPRESVLFVVQEQVRLDPAAQARRVYDFLGIRSDYVSQAMNRKANESYLPKSRGRERAIRMLGRAVRKSGLQWLDRAARRSGLVATLHRGNRLDIRSVVPPMTDETRARLVQVFAADTLDLAELIGLPSLPWPTWRAAQLLPRRDGDLSAHLLPTG